MIIIDSGGGCEYWVLFPAPGTIKKLAFSGLFYSLSIKAVQTLNFPSS